MTKLTIGNAQAQTRTAQGWKPEQFAAWRLTPDMISESKTREVWKLSTTVVGNFNVVIYASIPKQAGLTGANAQVVHADCYHIDKAAEDDLSPARGPYGQVTIDDVGRPTWEQWAGVISMTDEQLSAVGGMLTSAIQAIKVMSPWLQS